MSIDNVDDLENNNSSNNNNNNNNHYNKNYNNNNYNNNNGNNNSADKDTLNQYDGIRVSDVEDKLPSDDIICISNNNNNNNNNNSNNNNMSGLPSNTGEKIEEMNSVKENGCSKNDDVENSQFVIHNNLYPSACSNTVTLTSVSTKKTNVTSIEMRSSGSVPRKADIHNYLSSAIVLVEKK